MLAGALSVVGCGEKKTAEVSTPPAEQTAQTAAPQNDTVSLTKTETAETQVTETPPATEPATTYKETTRHTTTTHRTRTHRSSTGRTHYTEREPAEATPAVERRTSVIVPAGTPLTVTLSEEINTKTARPGSAFAGRLANDVDVDGRTVFPAGSRVEGHVVLSERAGQSTNHARLQLAFDRVIVGGVATDINSTGQVINGKASSGADAKRIGGGAAAGAVVGGIIGKDVKSAVKGAVVGAAAGTAASIAMKGADIDLDPGEHVQVALDRPIRVGGAALEAASGR
jgi:hypothetical protein